MLDNDGFRLNVGIILANSAGKLFWGQRIKAGGWQFPQGGVDPYETLEETMYRELQEEVGLTYNDVKIVAKTRHWLNYRLPGRLRRHNLRPFCIGQKQRWFLVLLTSDETRIDLNANQKPEFRGWKWVDYWEPLHEVIYFKRKVYQQALRELEPAFKRMLRQLATN